mgnify:CR=1 FL=1
MSKEKLYQYEDFGFKPDQKTEIKMLKERLAEAEKENASLKSENKNLKLERENEFLTGVKTRKHFTEKSEKIISIMTNPESAERREGEIIPNAISFAIADIDKFKVINDTKGHSEGDRILSEVGRVFKENIRDMDAVCRWGGEEFAIIFPNAKVTDAFKRVEELRKIIKKETGVTISIGVAEYEKGLSFTEALDRSDKALYLAKEEGRNRVKTYSDVLEKEKAE